MIKFINECQRVWNVTKKPNKKEYFTTLKIVLLGLLIIGLIGFVVEIFAQLVIKHIF